MSLEKTSWSRCTTGLILGTLLGLGGAILVASDLLQRLDLVLYDSLMELQYRVPSEQVVIVAIDDASLKEIGRWPWSRAIHAQLLDKLTDYQVRAVGFDILLSESEDEVNDGRFAAAMQRSGATVLAVAPEQPSRGAPLSESLPVPDLALGAAALGHVDVELDRDGLIRSVYLWAGLGGSSWPSFALALKQIAQPATGELPYHEIAPDAMAPRAPNTWVRNGRVLIPFVGPTGTFARYSYSDVLAGRLSPGALHDRIVLIGATAAGLGDVLATPASRGHERMPGVELNANILNMLLENTSIRQLGDFPVALITFAAILISVLLLTMRPIEHGLVTVLLIMAVTFCIMLVALMGFQTWFPAVPLLFLQLASYPVWSGISHAQGKRQLQLLHGQVDYQARHHAVTELPNQLGLHGYLEEKIANRPTPDRTMALLVLNLDPQGVSNDSLGFSDSSQLLKQLAQRLRENTRQDDLVAHLSGNDFAVVIDDLVDSEASRTIGAQLLSAFDSPLEAGGEKIRYLPAIGCSLYPSDATSADHLLMHAYAAMYKARQEREQEVCFYSVEIEREDSSRKQFERLLRDALGNSELQVHYQPQVIATNGRIVGVESLLRWHSPELGLVGPVKFIPVAEQTGIITDIGTWVLREACTQARTWMDDGQGKIRTAVNLSAQQFASPTLVETVSEILQETRLPPRLLELEITEGSLIQDVDQARVALRAFRRMGINVAIDDFGTGYSSLSYLKHFPLDRIKIDRSFVIEIGNSNSSSEIILAVIGMAHKLDMEVIAEGVETEEQAAFLRRHGCDEFQGYLFGRPVQAEQLSGQLSGAVKAG